MKIAILTGSISRLSGGLFDAVRELYLAVNDERIEMNVYSFLDEYSNYDIRYWENIQIKLFQNKNLFLFSIELKKEILKSDTDILHIHGLWRYPHLFINSWKRKTCKPVVVTPHGMLDPYILKMQGPVKRFIGRFLFKNTFNVIDCYHALCKKEMQDIRAYGLKQPVAIIPNGINLPNENIKFQSFDDKNHLLYLGRLHPKKGVDLLIKAIAGIKLENSLFLNNWTIDIVGWDHENTKKSLEELVVKYELEDNIIFHGGLFGEDKIRMYAISDAYILPSYGEGLPMTVLEAWSWNLPVLITENCNLPEGFDAKAAIKIDTNVDSVINGLEKLFNMSDEDRIKMGQNGYELVKEEFTWNSSAKKMTILYNWLLNGGEKPEFVYF